MTSVIMNYYRNSINDNISYSFVGDKKIAEGIKKEFDAREAKYYIAKNRKKNFLNYIYMLIRLSKKEKYDIVHVHGNSATMLIDIFPFIFSKTKIIIHVHNTKNDYPLFNKIFKLFLSSLVDARLSASSCAGEKLYGPLDFTVIKNGISIDNFEFNAIIRDQYRREFNISNSDIVYINVGALSEQKNQEILLESFKELEIRNNGVSRYLLIVGDGNKREHLLELKDNLGLKNVLFLGIRDDVSQLLNVADFLVMPSKWEAFPVISIEAQANGVRQIVSQAFTKETDLLGNSIFVKDYSTKEWSNAMLGAQATTDRHEAFKLVKEKGYSIKDCVKELENIYLKAFEGKLKSD
ncbi:glycosyltransferase involved in cell wall biosynthesis [Enterococcus lemanii]|nr:glycosyltransferase involved in cell wall biosynthesis [Enterococcus lemanii]